MVYGCLRNAESTNTPADHNEGLTKQLLSRNEDSDYSYVDLPVTRHDNDYY